MTHFDLLPPRTARWNDGAILSLVIHVAAVLPLALGHARTAENTDPVEQLVTFLVPPEREVGRRSQGRGVDWSGLVGAGGATEEPIRPVDRPEEVLPLGTAGDPKPAEPDAPSAPQVEETALTEIEVDSAVIRDPTSAAPVYPADLLAKNIEGSTFVHYVVDVEGRVDTTTIQVVRSTHPAFAQSVRDALAIMKFRPAIQSSQRVRQWVQQNFSFKIVRARPPASDST